jgi:hypothetical protein
VSILPFLCRKGRDEKDLDFWRYGRGRRGVSWAAVILRLNGLGVFIQGQESFGDFTYSNGKIALLFLSLDASMRTMLELTDAFGDEHRGEVAITHFLNSPIEKLVLGGQGTAS